MSSSARHGRLFVVSAPSGAGKTTVVDRLIAGTRGLRRSRSYTSRRARPGEIDGVDYNFVPRGRFEAMIAGDEFLEWAEYSGNLYGTAIVDTERELEAGTDLVLVIDVQGARQVRRHRAGSVLVFLLPPSAEVLEARLRARGDDSEEQIRQRLAVAREEVRAVTEYDYVVVNDDVDACAGWLKDIIQAERARVGAAGPEIAPILAGFGITAEIGGRVEHPGPTEAEVE
jgi:guanylate kinase